MAGLMISSEPQEERIEPRRRGDTAKTNLKFQIPKAVSPWFNPCSELRGVVAHAEGHQLLEEGLVVEPRFFRRVGEVVVARDVRVGVGLDEVEAPVRREAV